MVTPFSADGRKIDETALSNFIEWQIAEGASGLVPCGTTGESPVLTPAEHDHVAALTVEIVSKRVPVIVGTGSNATAEAIERTRHAETIGADVAMLVTPYYNKPNQEGMIQHFDAVLNETKSIPIIIYNIPPRSVVDLLPESFARLLHHERLIGVKDATQNLVRPAQMREVLAQTGRTDSFFQISGEDPTALAFLAQGGCGVISVTGNVAPRLMAQAQKLWQAGNFAAAEQIDTVLQPLHRAVFAAPSPAPAKYILSRAGMMEAAVRLPIVLPDESVQAQIDQAVKQAGLSFQTDKGHTDKATQSSAA